MSLTTSTQTETVNSDTHDGPVVDLREDPAGPTSQGSSGTSPSDAPTRPSFTITEAATACSVSRKTITRKLPELAGHGAAKDDDGVWRIPVEALLAVGLHPGRSLPTVPPPAATTVAAPPAPTYPMAQDTVTIPRDRWDDVRLRLARAEAEAAERALALADARLALRALTAGPRRDAEPQGQTGTAAHGLSAPLPASTGGGDSGHSGVAPAVPHGLAAAPAPVPSPVVDGALGSHGTVAQASNPGSVAPDSTAPGEAVPADVVAARNLAARTGGYVPAAAPVRKRRWWRSA